MNFDILQALFWALTYVLIIFVGIRYHKEFLPSMPLFSCLLNFSWEIIALVYCFPVWIHILWTGLDIIIFILNIQYLFKLKPLYGILYAAGLIVLLFGLSYVFVLERGMVISCFIIDLLMAIDYIVNIRRLSTHFRTTIGITKLIGDCFAWLAYKDVSIYITIIGIAVLIINIMYVVISYYLYSKAQWQQKHKKKGKA